MTVRSELLGRVMDKQIPLEISDFLESKNSKKELVVEENIRYVPHFISETTNANASDSMMFGYKIIDESVHEKLNSSLMNEDYFAGVLSKSQKMGFPNGFKGKKNSRSFDVLDSVLDHEEPMMFEHDESSYPIRMYLSEEISPIMSEIYRDVQDEIR